MKYSIIGADRKTGQDVKIVVEAASEKEAVSEAGARGLVIASCVRLKGGPGEPSAERGAVQGGGKSIWSRPAARIGIIVGAIVVVGSVALFLYTRHHNAQLQKELDAAADANYQMQMKGADALEKQNIELAKRAAEKRRRAAELRGTDSEQDAGTGSGTTKTQAIADDPLVSAYLSNYPDLRSPLLRSTGFGDLFDSKVTSLVAAGKIDAADAQYLRRFADKIHSLPD